VRRLWRTVKETHRGLDKFERLRAAPDVPAETPAETQAIEAMAAQAGERSAVQPIRLRPLFKRPCSDFEQKSQRHLNAKIT
jgi:hypothetical protein